MTAPTVPIAPPLVRIPRVELIHTGQWPISTGVWTATTEDLHAAVAALDCPAVRRPGLKIGHSDNRFTDPHGDGEPLLGYVDNMAVVEDGHTLVGDFAGMPAWLATADEQGQSVLASAYPDRSIEGIHDFQCQIGHRHPFVLTAVALLGVTAPGVGTLASLQDIAALYGVAASVNDNNGTPIRASMAVKAAASTGAMVALIPSDADAQRLAVDGGLTADDLHCTLMYLGKANTWDADQRVAAIEAVRGAALAAPLDAEAFAVSMFNPNGDEPCIVLGLGGDGLTELHDVITAAIGAVDGPTPEQRTPWLPHVTLRYTDDPALVADYTDLTGPIVFDRIRVAFAGINTDIPLSAPEESTVPNPNPTTVAAGVTTEDVRRAYYADADWDNWITEFHLDPLQLIVCDDRTGKYSRVPVTVSGEDQFEFGDPIEVLVRYVDAGKDNAVAAAAPVAVPGQRLVYASRAESRPGVRPKAADKATEPEATVLDTPQPDPAPVEPTPEDVPAQPPAQPADDPTTTEDPVSDLSDIARTLGLPDDAGKDAILAALAERKPADEPTEPTTAEPTPVEPERQPEPVAASLPPEAAAELKRMSEELAHIKAREAAGVKAALFDSAVKAGKLAPAERATWEARYDKAPDLVAEIIAAKSEGEAVPVNPHGYTGTGDEGSTDQIDAEYERMFTTSGKAAA